MSDYTPSFTMPGVGQGLSLAQKFMQMSRNIQGQPQQQPQSDEAERGASLMIPPMAPHPTLASRFMQMSQNIQGTPPWAPVQQQAPQQPPADPFIQMLHKLIYKTK